MSEAASSGPHETVEQLVAAYDEVCALSRATAATRALDDTVPHARMGRISRWRGGGVALTDQAIDRIKAMIVSGELSPGDRLPREADLAERLGLSRNSLREAVRALALIRVLDVRQGDGTYVTSLEPPLLLEAMSLVVDLHRDDDTVLQLLEVRRILEPAAAAMAAQQMPDLQVADLAKLLEALDQGAGVDALVAGDLEFHRRIAAGSGNAVLCSLLEGLSAPTTRARIWRGLTKEDAARTREQHSAIYEAIAARQPEAARTWAAAHVAGVEDWLRRAL